MDQLLLGIVVVSGLFAVSSAAVRRYHVVYELKNMTEAQHHCRENYIDLVTIRDRQDLETLNTALNLSRLVGDSSQAWIGLYRYMELWRWSLSNTSFYKPGEMEFRRWDFREPDNRMTIEHCTVMSGNGAWLDAPCDYLFKSVCFDVKGANTFVFINTLMTWTEAQKHCREHHTDLAIVRNEEENQMLYNVRPSRVISWIGLYRDGWKWSDGSNSLFRNWNPREPRGPSETCAAADFSANGQWKTLDCSIKSAFICYRDVGVAKRVMKVRLQKTSSSLDLNDPVVMEDLLKQLKQRLEDKRLEDQRLEDQGLEDQRLEDQGLEDQGLEDQRLKDGIKLSWKKQSDGKVFHEEEKKTRKKRMHEL